MEKNTIKQKSFRGGILNGSAVMQQADRFSYCIVVYLAGIHLMMMGGRCFLGGNEDWFLKVVFFPDGKFLSKFLLGMGLERSLELFSANFAD